MNTPIAFHCFSRPASADLSVIEQATLAVLKAEKFGKLRGLTPKETKERFASTLRAAGRETSGLPTVAQIRAAYRRLESLGFTESVGRDRWRLAAHHGAASQVGSSLRRVSA